MLLKNLLSLCLRLQWTLNWWEYFLNNGDYDIWDACARRYGTHLKGDLWRREREDNTKASAFMIYDPWLPPRFRQIHGKVLV